MSTVKGMSKLRERAQRWRDINRRRVAWVVARLLGFVVVSFSMAFPEIKRFSTHVPGNPGDAFLILALLRWGSARSTSFYSGFWQGPMFSSGHNVMAYTDTFLPLTLPFRAIDAVTGSPVVAFNVLYIMAWVLCLECTYLLLVRLTACRSVSIVGSLAFTFSTIRLTQTGHYQLMFAFFIPLALLLVFRLFDRPSIARGLVLAAVLAAQFLTTAYYGLILIVSISVIAFVLTIQRRHGPALRQIVTSLAAGFVMLVVLVGPTAVRYSEVQSTTNTRGAYPAGFALRLGDLRTAPPLSKHLGGIALLDNNSSSRSAENFAYIGIFAAVMIVASALGLVASQRVRSVFAERRTELSALAGMGIFAFAVAIGRGPILGLKMPFYDLAKAVIPGIRSMLAIVRLFVFTQLALVGAAAMGLAAFLQWRGSRTARLVFCAALSCLILFESAQFVPIVRVPTVAHDSVYAQLTDLPNDGVVAELPMAPLELGPTFAYLEATRMVLASGDSLRTVNGYSGFAPPGYEAIVDSLNTFPSAASLQTLRDLGAKYVVIHTTPMDTGLDEVTTTVNESGYAYVSPDKLAATLAALPPNAIKQRTDAADGVILILAPG